MKMHRSITGLTTLCLALLPCWPAAVRREVTFYTLNPLVPPETTAPAATLDSVVIGPVILPDLYDQPQLVVRVDANRVDILEMQRWAAPLKSEIPRIHRRGPGCPAQAGPGVGLSPERRPGCRIPCPDRYPALRDDRRAGGRS